MHMPGLSAEASIYGTSNHYRVGTAVELRTEFLWQQAGFPPQVVVTGDSAE